MADVARRAGVATTIFARWKAGLHSPTLRNYSRIVDVLIPPAPVPPVVAVPKRRQRQAAPTP